MKNTTKNFYYDDIWNKIETHPGYNLGRRELEALIRFLPTVAKHTPVPINILHLGIATGREVPHIIRSIRIKKYMLNDICKPVLSKTQTALQKQFSAVKFIAQQGDIELLGTVAKLRQGLKGLTLIILVANSVIFSNRQIDKNTHKVMEKNDLFLLTLEMPHPRMYDSYLIPPVLKLLSEGGVGVNQENIKCWYDDSEHCMKMACGEKILLSSCKPNPVQLRERMTNTGFSEVALAEYKNLHMTASLWRKK